MVMVAHSKNKKEQRKDRERGTLGRRDRGKQNGRDLASENIHRQ